MTTKKVAVASMKYEEVEGKTQMASTQKEGLYIKIRSTKCTAKREIINILEEKRVSRRSQKNSD